MKKLKSFICRVTSKENEKLLLKILTPQWLLIKGFERQRVRVKDQGKQVYGSTGGQDLTGGPWNLAIYGKGLQCQIFLDNGPFASEKVLAFKFRSRLSPLVP